MRRLAILSFWLGWLIGHVTGYERGTARLKTKIRAAYHDGVITGVLGARLWREDHRCQHEGEAPPAA